MRQAVAIAWLILTSYYIFLAKIYWTWAVWRARGNEQEQWSVCVTIGLSSTNSYYVCYTLHVLSLIWNWKMVLWFFLKILQTIGFILQYSPKLRIYSSKFPGLFPTPKNLRIFFLKAVCKPAWLPCGDVVIAVKRVL